MKSRPTWERWRQNRMDQFARRYAGSSEALNNKYSGTWLNSSKAFEGYAGLASVGQLAAGLAPLTALELAQAHRDITPSVRYCRLQDPRDTRSAGNA